MAGAITPAKSALATIENHQQVFQRGLPPGNLNRMPGAIDAMNEGMKKAKRTPEKDDHRDYADAAAGNLELVHSLPDEILLSAAKGQETLYCRRSFARS